MASATVYTPQPAWVTPDALRQNPPYFCAAGCGKRGTMRYRVTGAIRDPRDFDIEYRCDEHRPA